MCETGLRQIRAPQLELQALTNKPINKNRRQHNHMVSLNVACLKVDLLIRYSQNHGNDESRINHNSPNTVIGLHLTGVRSTLVTGGVDLQ